MHIKRTLLTAGIILIITGCNTTAYRSDNHPAISSHSNPATTDADTAPVTTTRVGQGEQAVSGSNDPITNTAQTPTQPEDAGATSVHQDVWKHISAGLQLNRHLQHRSVKDKLAWYTRNQDYLDRVADRARPYLYHIVAELEKRNMPLDLALLPVVESAYHPFAYSPSKASGIWQFIPSTGKRYGLKQNWWYDGRRDIVAATTAALDYLEKLHKEFNGDWMLALAAYNTGEKNVARAVRRNQLTGKGLDFFSLSLPRETRGYVPSLLAVAELIADPARHGINWKPIANEPYFAIVEPGTQLDLALVAELSGQTMDEVYTLNPAYNRWATDPDGPHTLLIPLANAASFKTGLSALPPADLVSWQRHVIKPGESLGLIAQNYQTSIEALKSANGIRGNLIHAGNSLLIPTSKRPAGHYTLSMDARRFQGLKKGGAGQEYIYTVSRGDTLWDIGQHYGISVERLCAWNGITSRSLLRPGQKLSLWLAEDGKALVAGNPTPAARSTIQDQVSASAADVTTYTVRNGDSLWLIARRNNLRVAQLTEWNGLKAGSSIKPGQVLKLQPRNNVVETSKEKNSNTIADNSQSAPSGSYTVRPGDSLWLIARRFGTTVEQLVNRNNLANGNQLRPGQQINLIATAYHDTGATENSNSEIINYTVKKGDSLWLISRRFGTTVAQLARWNNISASHRLQPGQVLVLYVNEA